MEREISELKVKLKESNERSEKYEAEVTRLSSKVECLERELKRKEERGGELHSTCLLYTSPSPRDRQKSRMPSSA